MRASDQPISIVGLLFGICVTFWAGNLANYLASHPFRHPTIFSLSGRSFTMSASGTSVTGSATLTKEHFTAQPTHQINTFVDALKVLQDEKTYILVRRPAEDEISGQIIPEKSRTKVTKLRAVFVAPDNGSAQDIKTTPSATLTVKGKKAINVNLTLPKDETKNDKSGGKITEASIRLGEVKYLGLLGFTDFTQSRSRWVLVLLSGFLFLINILCVLWWFAKYIYRIQPVSSLRTHFLDFSLVGMFVLAASRWDEERIFLTATAFASVILLLRFYWLYKDPDATGTDRLILNTAKRALLFALAIVGASVLAIMGFLTPWGSDEFYNFILPTIPGLLSGIGIFLTFWVRDKITIAVDIHEVSSRPFTPMELHWPPPISADGDATERIRQSTTDGLESFRNLFRDASGQLTYEIVRSRVHPDADQRVQSYILSIPSWRQEHQEEVKRKTIMVAVSHWLDDLLDGRNEVVIFNKIRNMGNYGLDLHTSETIFKEIYHDVIDKHTGPGFFRKLTEEIKNAATLPVNDKYLFWGLNRVAVGAVIFGPRVYDKNRKEVGEAHNRALQSLISNSDTWSRDINVLLGRMQGKPVGRILLGLTTKTAQEISMASEERPVDFALSLLYSILYTPLLYFHDVHTELESREMVPLDTFDVNYAVTVPWLRQCRRLCEDERVDDDRRADRLQQLEMAFLCFENKLPQAVKSTLKPIYICAPSPPAEPAGTKAAADIVRLA